MLTRQRMYAAALVALLALGGGYAAWRHFGHRQAPALIRLSTTRTPSASLPFLAQRLDLFASQNLQVDIKSHSAGRDALADVTSGRADVAVCAEIPILHAWLDGHRLKILATVGSMSEAILIVGRKDRGIQKPADLRGKTIGVVPQTNGVYIANRFVTFHGIESESVKLIPHTPVTITDALREGKVDAIVFWEPDISSLRQEMGDAVVAFNTDAIYTWSFHLVTTESYLQAHSPDVTRLLAVLQTALDRFNESPEILQRVKDDIGPSKANIEAMLDRVDPTLYLDRTLLTLMDEQVRWITGEPSSSLDTRALIAAAPLISVAPESVALSGHAEP